MHAFKNSFSGFAPGGRKYLLIRKDVESLFTIGRNKGIKTPAKNVKMKLRRFMEYLNEFILVRSDGFSRFFWDVEYMLYFIYRLKPSLRTVH